MPKDTTTHAVVNTDRVIWRKVEGDYYSPSIHVTVHGGIGIETGGTVYVMPVEAWYALAVEKHAAPLTPPDAGTEKALSRQRKWQVRQHAAGNCETCGKARERDYYTRCDACIEADAARKRVEKRYYTLDEIRPEPQQTPSLEDRLRQLSATWRETAHNSFPEGAGMYECADELDEAIGGKK